MGDDDERPAYHDRDKKSFAERDRMRRESRPGEARPRDPAAQRRSAAGAQAYLKQLDQLFVGGPGGADGKRLARAMLDARGTPGLSDACRAYLDAVGPPREARLISCFLDTGDRELVCAGLEALRETRARAELEVSAGLLRQLRMLADGPDDEVAEHAEALMDDI